MWAQIAALRTGQKRFIELCDRYGLEKVEKAIEMFLEQGKESARLALKKLPKGVFEAEGYIEDDPEIGGPYPIKVKVEITDDKFICDFRGSHPQVQSPVNCSYYGLLASVRVIYLATIYPTKNINEGVFYPLEIKTDKCSIVSAERPAPVSMNFEARLGGADLIW